jgi:RNA polymerase sigma-70 factor (ECF subfamily)
VTHGLRLVRDETPNSDSAASAPALDAQIAAIRAGDRQAFTFVYNTLAKDLIEFAANMLGDLPAGEDIVADVFIALWKRRESWDPPQGARAYLFTAVRNGIIDALRRTQIHARIHDMLITDEGVPGTSAAPLPVEQALDIAEQIEAAFRTIAQFPEARRIAMTLHWRNGLTAPEIATVMGITENAVYLHLSRGLRLLKQHYPRNAE